MTYMMIMEPTTPPTLSTAATATTTASSADANNFLQPGNAANATSIVTATSSSDNASSSVNLPSTTRFGAGFSFLPSTVATVTAALITGLVIQYQPLESTVLSLSLVVLITLLTLLVYTVWYYRLPVSPHSGFFEDILLGHRGCVKDEFNCMENSITAMRHAVSFPKVNGVEFDVMLSADNVPIVFHDTDRVSRVCKENPAVQKELLFQDSVNVVEPKIRNMTLDQIKCYEYRIGPAEDRIPTLEETVAACVQMNPAMRMMIELKEFHNAQVLAAKVVDVIARYNLYETAVVGSFNPVILHHVRRIDPRVVTLLLTRKGLISTWTGFQRSETDNDAPDFRDLGYLGVLATYGNAVLLDWILYWSSLTWLPWFLGVGVIGFHAELIKDGSIDVRHFQRRGYSVNVWVVNTEEEKKHLESVGRVAITTDFLFA